MLGGIEALQIAGARMRHDTQRTSVIARNLANADTPRFRALDVRPFTVQSPLVASGNSRSTAPLGLTTTRTGHVGRSSGGAARTVVERSSLYGEKPDGNTVSIEEQMQKAADTAHSLDIANTTYRKLAGIMRIAAAPSR